MPHARFPDILKDLVSKDGILPVLAVPKSPRSEIIGIVESEGKRWLKIKVAAPPEDGKANAELIKFLARHFKCPKSALTLVSGETSRHKRIRIDNADNYHNG